MTDIDTMTVHQQFEAGVGPYEHARFGRVVTAMVTPFDLDESVSVPEAQKLVRYLEANGSEGIVPAGSTGESLTLKTGEKIELFEAVREVSSVPILAATGSSSTKEAMELTRRVAKSKLADGVLVISPIGNRPSQYGIELYFRQVAEAAGDLPVIMYNIPMRTGRSMTTETILRLAEVDNIVGLKDATGKDALGDTRILMERKPRDFQIYSGDDMLNLKLAHLGAVGAISVASHWAGKELQQMFDALSVGNYLLAGKIHQRLIASYEFESSDRTPNPHPAKAMMRTLGIGVSYCRLPMALEPGGERELEDQAREVYNDLLQAA